MGDDQYPWSHHTPFSCQGNWRDYPGKYMRKAVWTQLTCCNASAVPTAVGTRLRELNEEPIPDCHWHSNMKHSGVQTGTWNSRLINNQSKATVFQWESVFFSLRENCSYPFGKEEWTGELHQIGLWDLRKEHEDGAKQGTLMMILSPASFFLGPYTSQPLPHLLTSRGISKSWSLL